ncbi:protein CUSTOS-like [Chelonus insularis]|uniref:protein CUSTOS-like n=1 Tax=Chelonus insularis TaxID=460826 RepID=UPI00158AC5D5|nr:protein CUSTOS-like [Chelonus insularis]XP_034938217.1 protein CUSTOS-like [Chelonus insularis]
MSDKVNDYSSSDDEFTKQALKEATDQEFFTNSLFKAKKAEGKHESEKATNSDENLEKQLKPSLRINPHRVDNFHSFGVTQSYKDYVAKKLSEILDREIEIEDVENKEEHESSENKVNLVGIKLLKTSAHILTGDEIEEQKVLSKRKRPSIHSEKTTEILSKCREAAVDPEKIISKLEVQSWDERQRGTVFKYKKLADGSLIER